MEEEGEDVDDVEVNVERGEDVLLWTHGVTLVPHEELGVKRQKLKQRTKQQVRQLNVKVSASYVVQQIINFNR